MSNDTAAESAPLRSDRRPARCRRGWVFFLRDVLVILLVAVLVSFLVKTFVARSFFIPSSSMEETLLIKDRILVDELTLRWTSYHRGDVIVFKDPGGWLPPQPPKPARSPIEEAGEWLLTLVGIAVPDSDYHLVKRLIGLPGDRVVCCNVLGQITINGSAIEETSYIKLPPGDTKASNVPFDVTVPEGTVWVLGDNRNRSQDSRYHQDQPGEGFVPMSNIVGRAFFITWPFDRFRVIDSHYSVFSGVEERRNAGRTRTGRAADRGTRG